MPLVQSASICTLNVGEETPLDTNECRLQILMKHCAVTALDGERNA